MSLDIVFTLVYVIVVVLTVTWSWAMTCMSVQKTSKKNASFGSVSNIFAVVYT